ncbi:MAG: peptide chain release factor-like protein [Candidatus Saganbacteria bacterium]|nr:peptide chain release factor-like protein [Candidatus Saganbacteria bacterium]
MSRFPGISPNKGQALEKKLVGLGLDRTTVIEKFVRSGGPGGQHINKTATCVYLKHLPTGTEVKVAQERSQALNRFLAWRLLAEKIEEYKHRIKSEKQKRIEKIRRQKRKRSKRAQEKVLQQKKRQAEKKRTRKIQKADWT